MPINQNASAAPGWTGGFAESNPDFAYPEPNLTSLKMLDNLANIPNIKRPQAVRWPEFSWETKQGTPSSRCFEMFANNISRVGYDDTGRIWSIICPQQGIDIPKIATLNIEVTVTGQRGWVDETDQKLAADISVEGRIWFSPSAHQNWFVRKAWDLFKAKSLPFPSDKANAIRVTTHMDGSPDQPAFPGRSGESKRFVAPAFARHPEAWATGHLDVQIGPIKETGHHTVDTFNQKLLDIANISSGNMLQDGNVLTWNVWMTAPELVDTKEWSTHAERWRHSIDVDHGKSPEGKVSSKARYADGTDFKAKDEVGKELEDVVKILESLL